MGRIDQIFGKMTQHIVRHRQVFWSERVVTVGVVEVGRISQIALDDVSDGCIWRYGHYVQFLDFSLAQKFEIADGKWFALRLSIQIIRVQVRNLTGRTTTIISFDVRVVYSRITLGYRGDATAHVILD